MDVGFLHHRPERLFRPPPRLQERGVVAARPHLRHGQLERPDPRIPRARPAAVAICPPRLGAFIAVSADQVGDLRLHQRPREDPHALAQHVALLLLQQLANERRQIHPGYGHPSSPFRACPSARRTHGNDAQWPLRCLHAATCRISTTFWGANWSIGSSSWRPSMGAMAIGGSRGCCGGGNVRVKKRAQWIAKAVRSYRYRNHLYISGARAYTTILTWARRLKQRRRETGAVAPRAQRYGPRPVLAPHLATLAALLQAPPDRRLADLQAALPTARQRRHLSRRSP